MDISQSLLDEVPGLTGPSGKVVLGPAGRRSWLWRFPGILLLAAAAGGPVTSAGGVYPATSPSAQIQKAWLTSHVSVAARTFPQTITFKQPPGVTVGTPVSLSAHASSGLPVLFSSDTPSVCTVTDSTVTTAAAGTCTITASQSGGGYIAAAPDVTRSFQVRVPATPTITFEQPPDAAVGTPVPLTVSSSVPDMPVLFRPDTPLVCTGADTTVTTVAVGTCTITAYQARETHQVAPDVTRSFRVTPVQARL